MDQTKITAIEAALLAWLAGASGLDSENVIMSHDNGPNVESGPYITLEMFTEADTESVDDEDGIDDDGELYSTTDWVIGCSVDAYRSGGVAALTTLKSRSKLTAYYRPLQLADIAADCGAIRNLPEQKNGRWEEHAQMDLTVRVYGVITTEGAGDAATGWFNRVGVSIEREGEPFITDQIIIGD